MKKNILLFGILILLFSLNANSQDNKIKFGIKAGINYSTFILGKDIPNEFPADFNGKIGFHIGGFLSLNLTNNLILNPELLFSTQSAEYELKTGLIGSDEPLNNINYKADIKQNLILLPIMLDYHFNNNISIEIGPQAGYVVNQNVTDNNDNLSYGNGSFDKFEMAVNLGIGYSFSNDYQIGLRYNYAIIERDNTKSSVFQISFNYSL